MDQSLALSTATSFIADEESFSANPYWDSNGYAIGYGNHYYEDGSAVSADDDPISEDDAMALLSFYVNQNMQAIIAQVTAPLNENQLAALTSLRYNCGTITNAVLNLINSGATAAAVAAQIQMTCTTSGGVSNADLIVRRQQEAALYTSAVGGISTNTAMIVGAVALFVVGWIVLSNRK